MTKEPQASAEATTFRREEIPTEATSEEVSVEVPMKKSREEEVSLPTLAGEARLRHAKENKKITPIMMERDFDGGSGKTY